MNQKLTLNPAADSSDDVATPTDDAVRQALLRMGSGKPRAAGGFQHGGQHNGGQRRGGEQAQAAAASPDARRRRFSQNENVPVEYVSRDRQPGRHEPLRLDLGRADAQEPADDRAGFLERELERERQARLAVERALEEARTALTAVRTRVAHLEIDIQEARAQRQAMLDMAQSAAQSAAQTAAQQNAAQQNAVQAVEARAGAAIAVDDEDEAFDPDPMSASPARRGRGRPRRALSSPAEPEPEPVKWWIDD